MLTNSKVIHILSTKFSELCTFCFLKKVLTTCYDFFTSKHGTDLFQIIHSVKIAFVQKRIWISRRFGQRFSIWWKPKMGGRCLWLFVSCEFYFFTTNKTKNMINYKEKRKWSTGRVIKICRSATFRERKGFWGCIC